MLTVSQLSESSAGRTLFDDVSLQVNRGDRIGWLAPMGSITGRSRSRRTQPSDFFRRKPPFKFEKRCHLFVGGNDEPVSIVAMHSNIAFDFVELKLDGVLHDG